MVQDLELPTVNAWICRWQNLLLEEQVAEQVFLVNELLVSMVEDGPDVAMVLVNVESCLVELDDVVVFVVLAVIVSCRGRDRRHTLEFRHLLELVVLESLGKMMLDDDLDVLVVNDCDLLRVEELHP